MYIYFKKGYSIWSDNDYSFQDKTPYYKAPDDLKVGTPCQLVDGKIEKLPDREIQKIKDDKENISLIDKLTNELTFEKNRRIQTISADIRSIFNKQGEKYYTGDSWEHFHQRLQNVILNPTNHSSKMITAAKSVIDRIVPTDEKSDQIIESLNALSLQALKEFNPSDNNHWAD